MVEPCLAKTARRRCRCGRGKSKNTLVSIPLLLPSDLIGYGKSLLATLVFSANIYFWRDTDYFSPAAEHKPLLPIWSLGVEEQFYIAEPGWNVASTLSRQLAFGHSPDRPAFLPAADFERRLGSAIQHFESRRDIGFARPDKVQCPDERCYFVLDGRSLFSDSNHVASAELPRFRAMFEAALGAQPPR